MFNCEFCNNQYKTISSLNHHKKTTKKCLILRDAINTAYFFECKTCDFKTTVKDSLNFHKCKLKDISEYKEYIHKLELDLKIITEKNKELLNHNIELQVKLVEEKNNYTKELKDRLEKQENQIFSLASKPSIKIQNLNTVLTSLDFKENSIKDKVDNNFTLEYLSEGIKGLAKFTKEHIINPSEDGKQKYICSDPSRGTFK